MTFFNSIDQLCEGIPGAWWKDLKGGAVLASIPSLPALSEVSTLVHGSKNWTFGSLSQDDSIESVRVGRPTQLLLDSYEEARAALEPAVERIQSSVPSTRRKRRNGDSGDEINVDRYLSGDPDCWVSRKRCGRRRLVHIAVPLVQSGATSEEGFARSVGFSIAACDIMERAGYATRVTGATVISPDGRRDVAIQVGLKEPGERLDPSALLAAGLTGASRYHVFGIARSVIGVHGASILWGLRLTLPEVKDVLGYDYLVGMNTDYNVQAEAFLEGVLGQDEIMEHPWNR